VTLKAFRNSVEEKQEVNQRSSEFSGVVMKTLAIMAVLFTQMACLHAPVSSSMQNLEFVG
jgi:hypothetical protein